MLPFATDGFYWPRGAQIPIRDAPPPPCPLPPTAQALEPDAVTAMELAPLDTTADAVEPQEACVTSPNDGVKTTASELKPLAPSATREDKC